MSQELENQVVNLQKEIEGRKSHANHLERMLLETQCERDAIRQILNNLVNDTITLNSRAILNGHESANLNAQIRGANAEVERLQGIANSKQTEIDYLQNVVADLQSKLFLKKEAAPIVKKRGRKKKEA